jgi:gluconate 5-dehydrogenase
MKNLFDLKEKVAIVTGGYSYLGTSISEVLAEYGATVYIAGKNKTSAGNVIAKQPKGNKIKFIDCNVSNFESVKNCFEKIYKLEGKIDILVNNANYGKAGKLDTIPEKDWITGIDGTINNYFRCIQTALKYMKKNGGVIINVASMYGMVSPNPEVYGTSGFDNPPNYGAGKAAIIQLTKYAAVHFAKYNIRVNSISPGAFPKPSVQKNKTFIKNLSKKIPLGRIGSPDELKGTIILLASNASSYITGKNICVDGGWTIW